MELPTTEEAIGALVGITGVQTPEVTVAEIGGFTANSGMKAPALTGLSARDGMFVVPVEKQGNWENPTNHQAPIAPGQSKAAMSSKVSQSAFKGHAKWSTKDHIIAYKRVSGSGLYNFQGCKIPIPTSIRYDKLKDALGEGASPKEHKILKLLEFGFPLGCKPGYGVTKPQKNHKSALEFRDKLDKYVEKNVQSQAMLGPFEQSPIPGLCFSPLMSVPKEEYERRVIVDFSFPPGSSINDGIPQDTYLECGTEFNLPSIKSMVSRLNTLGRGCLLYKRDLKGAFKQFSIDPGDYKFSGLSWQGKVYIDTRLAMGLRSAAYCCQGVTEMVARVAGKVGHVLVYLDDFGGADLGSKAFDTFKYLGETLEHFGLEEAQEKAVAPTTRMDWLGITFDSIEWTMSLKQGKLDELLEWLPKLLKYKRVKKVLLQKILGSLVWASTVVRSGAIFFNRLLALLRKLKRPHHSIYFSNEAKKDVEWWLKSLKLFNGKSPIPPEVWTPLVSFTTDASLDGFGMV